MTQQYLRRCSLIVSTGSQGLDLSALRIQFRVMQADVDSPNTLVARVWNLSRQTAQSIRDEYQQVTLQAGYQAGNFAIIFQGTIKQVKQGRANARDTYVDIFAGDGDEAYNFAVVNKALAAGSKVRDQLDATTQAMQKFNVSQGYIPNELGTGGTLPRGKVLFGMAREQMNQITASTGTSWSIQNGKVIVIEETGYLPDEVAVLTSDTGLIGSPEATENGVEATILLNPLIKIGQRVQINNASINQRKIIEQGFPRYSDLSFPANTTADGIYRALVIEHEGDTWGDPWYSYITCLAVDPSSSPGSSVLPSG